MVTHEHKNKNDNNFSRPDFYWKPWLTHQVGKDTLITKNLIVLALKGKLCVSFTMFPHCSSKSETQLEAEDAGVPLKQDFSQACTPQSLDLKTENTS